MEKNSWTERVRTEEVLVRVKKEKNMLLKINRTKANYISHISLRNCLLNNVIECKV